MSKTKEIRAKELYVMVHGKGDAGEYFNQMNPGIMEGWLKLGKFVLNLEKKWAAVKKKKKS